MLVRFCSDPRSAATSSHTAGVEAEPDADGTGALADGTAALAEELPADAGLPAELPLELHAAGNSAKADSRMIRDAWRLTRGLLMAAR
jgi:hypothetical protein